MENEETLIFKCLRLGNLLPTVNETLSLNLLEPITQIKYEWFARKLSKINHMHQRNIDAIAWGKSNAK